LASINHWEDPSIINGYPEEGFGFGVIAQALWISRNLTGTENTPGDASLQDHGNGKDKQEKEKKEKKDKKHKP
jgi:hypothetical protein